MTATVRIDPTNANVMKQMIQGSLRNFIDAIKDSKLSDLHFSIEDSSVTESISSLKLKTPE